MLLFILRRLGAGVVLLLAMSLVTFILLYLGGGDIARKILGESATADAVDQLTANLGLDRPLLVQYGDWVASAGRGDLGASWFTSQQVSITLASRFGVTVSLALCAAIISTIIAVVIGVMAARRGGWLDAAQQFLSVVGMAVPNYLIALVLVLVFAINLHWFRATGYVPLSESFPQWLGSITLPVIALSIGAITAVAQQIRGSVLDALSRDYVRTLRSRGLGMNRVIFEHVLRNAGGPALAVFGLQFVGMLGGAVVIEQIFALPGIGQLAVQATSNGDIPVVMGVVMATGVIVVVVNLLIDIAQAALNPKVRLS